MKKLTYKIKMKYLLAFCLSCFVLIQNLSAAIERFNIRVSSDKITSSGVYTVVDDKIEFLKSGKTNYFTGNTVRNTIKLTFDDKFIVEDKIATSPLTVSFEVEGFTYINGQYVSMGKTPVTLKLDNSVINPVSQQIYSFTGAYKIQISKVEIEGVYTGPRFSLEAEIETERYYNFSQVLPSDFKIMHKPIDLNGEVELVWNTVEGAEYYDLEWTFVDDNGSNGSKLNTVNIDSRIFQFNSSRVTIKENHYKFPYLYDKGYILYRVRAGGKGSRTVAGETGFYDKIGEWSYNGTCTTMDCYNTTSKGAYYYCNEPHNERLNWQSTTTYAEEGKSKAVVSYSDGSLHNRQVVTKSNTTDESIVGETIYDRQGRPAVNILPVPTNDSKLDFHPEFNKSVDETPYCYEDFDVNATDANALSTSSGAGKYYSALNPDKNIGINKYVPDANGFAFTQVEYTPDNTGRVAKQGSVGENGQLDISGTKTAEHVTGNVYSSVEQDELDMMFGSEAGYAKYYRKTMTTDPNGQISITYYDENDKVVATRLTGAIPDNMVSMASNTIPINVDLLGKIDPSDTKDLSCGVLNSKDVDNGTLIVEKPIAVANEVDYEFEYKIDGTVLNKSCTNGDKNFVGVYDLTLSLKDNKGKEYLLGSPVEVGQQIYSDVKSGKTVDLTSGVASKYTFAPTPTVNKLKPGNYFLKKELKVNREVLDYYTNQYISDPSCFNVTLDDLKKAEYENLDYTQCYGCEICDIISKNPYSTTKFWYVNDPSECNPCLTQEQYDNFKTNYCVKQCVAADMPSDGASRLFSILIQDIKPNGQYGEIRKTGGNADGVIIAPTADAELTPEVFLLSIYNESNLLPIKKFDWFYDGNGVKPNWRKPAIYIKSDGTNLPIGYYEKDENGNLVLSEINDRLATMTLEEFLKEWKDEFANSLVFYHPEFMYFEYLSINVSNRVGAQKYSSEEFDQLLISSKEEKEVTGTIGVYDILTFDPFYIYRSSEKAKMQMRMRDYFKYNGNYYSAFAMACYSVMNAKSSSCNVGRLDLTSIVGKNDSYLKTEYVDKFNNKQKSNFWAYYKNFYLALKKEIVDASANEEATRGNGYNGCIGNQNFNVFNDGLYYKIFTDNLGVSGLTHQVLWFKFLKSQAFNLCQPCNMIKAYDDRPYYELYKNKEKRYSSGLAPYEDLLAKRECYDNEGVKYECPDPTDMIKASQEVLANIANVSGYEQCKQCPDARNLQTLVSALINDENYIDVDGNPTNTLCDTKYLSCDYPAYLQQLEDALFPGHGSIASPVEWDVTDAGDVSGFFEAKFKGPTDVPLKMKIPFDDISLISDDVDLSVISSVEKAKLDQKYSDFTAMMRQKTFSDIKSICCIRYLAPEDRLAGDMSDANFEAKVTFRYSNTDKALLTLSDEMKQYRMVGKIGTLNLGGCEAEFKETCVASEEAKDLQNLLNGLLKMGMNEWEDKELFKKAYFDLQLSSRKANSEIANIDLMSYNNTLMTDKLMTAMDENNITDGMSNLNNYILEWSCHQTVVPADINGVTYNKSSFKINAYDYNDIRESYDYKGVVMNLNLYSLYSRSDVSIGLISFTNIKPAPEYGDEHWFTIEAVYKDKTETFIGWSNAFITGTCGKDIKEDFNISGDDFVNSGYYATGSYTNQYTSCVLDAIENSKSYGLRLSYNYNAEENGFDLSDEFVYRFGAKCDKLTYGNIKFIVYIEDSELRERAIMGSEGAAYVFFENSKMTFDEEKISVYGKNNYFIITGAKTYIGGVRELSPIKCYLEILEDRDDNYIKNGSVCNAYPSVNTACNSTKAADKMLNILNEWYPRSKEYYGETDLINNWSYYEKGDGFKTRDIELNIRQEDQTTISRTNLSGLLNKAFVTRMFFPINALINDETGCFVGSISAEDGIRAKYDNCYGLELKSMTQNFRCTQIDYFSNLYPNPSKVADNGESESFLVLAHMINGEVIQLEATIPGVIFGTCNCKITNHVKGGDFENLDLTNSAKFPFKTDYTYKQQSLVSDVNPIYNRQYTIVSSTASDIVEGVSSKTTASESSNWGVLSAYDLRPSYIFKSDEINKLGNCLLVNTDDRNVDDNINTNELRVWSQAVSGLKPHRYHKISFKVKNPYYDDQPSGGFDGDHNGHGARLQLKINGVDFVDMESHKVVDGKEQENVLSIRPVISLSNEKWIEYSFLWNPGYKSSVNLAFYEHYICSKSYLTDLCIDDIKVESLERNPNAPVLACNGNTKTYSGDDKSLMCCLPDMSVLTFDKVDNCKSDLIENAEYRAQAKYGDMLEEEKKKFRREYIQTCLGAFEKFSMKYDDLEQIYTLYYYDQAGNLVKTIPPQGVTLLTTPTSLTAVRKERSQGAVTTLPAHTMATLYKYNSLNQLVAQYMPDHEKFPTGHPFANFSAHFVYDELGRMVLSQNAEQYNQNSNRYSYTIYDYLGRIKEVGQVVLSSFYAGQVLRTGKVKYSRYLSLVKTSSVRTQVVKTFYDTEPDFRTRLTQENLRSRVSAVIYQDVCNADNYVHNSATYYSYDIHGNVKRLWQETNVDGEQIIKSVLYGYDLISGKVNTVCYEPGRDDQMIHRYEYDADNRITNVYTSIDGRTWDQDAKYFYYKHGPLARTELGDSKVQGLDYAYTLQGWIKAVNGFYLDGNSDLGGDAKIAIDNLNQYVSKDAFSFALGYNNNDYTPIGGAASMNFLASNENSIYSNHPNQGLYNGNIDHMNTTIMKSTAAGGEINAVDPLLSVYKYDQLNRLRDVKSYKYSSSGLIDFAKKCYDNTFTYDKNGNINTLTRSNDNNAVMFDNLTYKYQTGTNKLSYVEDLGGSLGYDVGNQAANNYTYDKIGNLKSDKSEHIANIEWTVTGKVKAVIRDKHVISETHNPGSDLEFAYDAMGNRILKIEKPNYYENRVGEWINKPTSDWNYTHYVRDAQGNIMATYTKTGSANAYALKEQPIYGSSMLGVRNAESGYSLQTIAGTGVANGILTSRSLGLKQYQLTNHLGNVLSTVSDQKKFAVDSDPTNDYFSADVITSNDYFAFGMNIKERSFNAQSEPYRYGFNGKEKADEISEGDYDFGARIYDSRTITWKSPDPLASKYPSLSPYAFCNNNPIYNIEVDGRYFTGNTESVKAVYAMACILAADGKNKEAVAFKSALEKMDASDIEFNIINTQKRAFGDHDGGVGGSTTFDSENNKVVIDVYQYSGGEHFINEMSRTAHELEHGDQFMEGEIEYNSNCTPNVSYYDETDEYDAFRTQNMFSNATREPNEKERTDIDAFNSAKEYDLPVKEKSSITPEQGEMYRNSIGNKKKNAYTYRPTEKQKQDKKSILNADAEN